MPAAVLRFGVRALGLCGLSDHYRRPSSDASDPIRPTVRMSASLPDVLGQTLQALLQGCTAIALVDRSHRRIDGYRVAFQQTLFRWHMQHEQIDQSPWPRNRALFRWFLPHLLQAIPSGKPVR